MKRPFFWILAVCTLFISIYWYRSTGIYLLEARSYLHSLNLRPPPQGSGSTEKVPSRPLVHHLYLLNSLIDMDILLKRRRNDQEIRRYFQSLPEPQRDLLAASICYLDTVHGFYRYFQSHNQSVTLMAASAFKKFGMEKTAAALMRAFELQEKQKPMRREVFKNLDESFFHGLASEQGGWELVSDKFAKEETERLTKLGQIIPCNFACIIAPYIDFRWIPSRPIEDALSSFHAAPQEVQILYSTYLTLDDIRRDGFYGYFGNSDGWMAPEAVDGLRKLGMNQAASVLENAMAKFGSDYPRNSEVRGKILKTSLDLQSFEGLNRNFYSAVESDNGGWDSQAKKLTESFLRQHYKFPVLFQ